MNSVSNQFFVPSSNVVVEIIMPTIIFCIGMVIAMIIGINKCREWELANVGEIRRTRLIIQRLNARLRERNFKAIQRAKDIRRRNLAEKITQNQIKNEQKLVRPPPFYGNEASNSTSSGRSPPPTYEDSLLDELYRKMNVYPSTANLLITLKLVF
ncbi:hypothetical protein Mgra_00003237 [Meloidogyne graminicola]|uniref:Uncharacterized protein n=1 Tax=Meloidogyne graminicola TaxID=189291 RepID=A0A8S9ZWE2_9BILA|nr:hypothetical protein Mgra_00003237 [Meloidogyne graminicola]